MGFIFLHSWVNITPTALSFCGVSLRKQEEADLDVYSCCGSDVSSLEGGRTQI